MLPHELRISRLTHPRATSLAIGLLMGVFAVLALANQLLV